MPALSPVPARLTIDGRTHVVLDTMANVHYRALVLPEGGGSPRWLTNEQVGKANGSNSAAICQPPAIPR